MNEIERKLLAQRLAEPSRELERRMMKTFAAAREMPRMSRSLIGWWSLAAAVAGVGIGVFLAIPQRVAPVPANPVVYRIEAEGLLREMLLNSAGGRDVPPVFEISGSKGQTKREGERAL